LNEVRAFDAGAKKEMWGEALYIATYILNRSPSEVLKKIYEMWEEKKPNLKNLQIFGCNSYAKIFELFKKLDSRSECYKFVGYAPYGYRLWDNKRKIIIARDVKFKITDKSNQQKRKKSERRERNQKNKLVEGRK